jgi:hypothetical protein
VCEMLPTRPKIVHALEDGKQNSRRDTGPLGTERTQPFFPMFSEHRTQKCIRGMFDTFDVVL